MLIAIGFLVAAAIGFTGWAIYSKSRRVARRRSMARSRMRAAENWQKVLDRNAAGVEKRDI